MLRIHMKQKYQLLIKKREGVGLKYYNDSEDSFEYSNGIDDIYVSIKQ